jgi:hypothetical protein
MVLLEPTNTIVQWIGSGRSVQILTVTRKEENAMSIVVKAAAVQLSPVLYSREGTIDNIVRKIHDLGKAGVQFATFPETVVPYYPYFSFIQSAYQIIAGREHLRLLDQPRIPAVAASARFPAAVLPRLWRPMAR